MNYIFSVTTFSLSKQAKKLHSCGHLVRNNGPFKIFKNLNYSAMCFQKTKNDKTLNFLLVKNIDKEFSGLKI